MAEPRDGAMLREEIEERVDQVVEERAERRARREVADDRVARPIRQRRKTASQSCFLLPQW